MKMGREPIFKATVRTLFTSFAMVLGVGIAIILIVIGINYGSPTIGLPASTEVSVSPDAEGKREILSESSPVILRIDIHGIIGDLSLTNENFENMLLNSREGMFKNNRVKGILLHINTPGGVVTDADDIYHAITEYKKKYKVPVYAYVDGLCASGGMYIASAVDRIYAAPSSVIGSVGVIISTAFNFSQLMDKYGVQSVTITEGKDKDMLNPFRPWKEGEGKSLRAITTAAYERFVTILTEARPQLDREKLINEYGAQVYIASKAKELGYIDETDCYYEKALADLAKAAGIPEKKEYQVLLMQPQHSFIQDLTRGSKALLQGKMSFPFQLPTNFNSDMNGKLLFLYLGAAKQ